MSEAGKQMTYEVDSGVEEEALEGQAEWLVLDKAWGVEQGSRETDLSNRDVHEVDVANYFSAKVSAHQVLHTLQLSQCNAEPW